jgi:hypothetical protein
VSRAQAYGCHSVLRNTRVLAPVAISLSLMVAGCGVGPIAVRNESDSTFYLKYEGKLVWRVPAHTDGIGPTDTDSVVAGRRVQLLDQDCRQLAMCGFHESTTIVVSTNGSIQTVDGVDTNADLPRADEACPDA